MPRVTQTSLAASNSCKEALFRSLRSCSIHCTKAEDDCTPEHDKAPALVQSSKEDFLPGPTHLNVGEDFQQVVVVPSRFEAFAFETLTRMALLAFEEIAHEMA